MRSNESTHESTQLVCLQSHGVWSDHLPTCLQKAVLHVWHLTLSSHPKDPEEEGSPKDAEWLQKAAPYSSCSQLVGLGSLVD